MWNGWKRLAAHASKHQAALTIEWAWDCSLHRLKYVRKFVDDHGMVGRKVAGCVFGLSSIIEATRGRPLCKAWGIWTNSKPLAVALDGPHVRCSGCVDSVAVGGRDTAHTGSYTDAFASFVNRVVTKTELETWRLLEELSNPQA